MTKTKCGCPDCRGNSIYPCRKLDEERAQCEATYHELEKAKAKSERIGWRKGMTEAANVCCDQQRYFTQEASVQCLQNHDAIINARNAKGKAAK